MTKNLTPVTNDTQGPDKESVTQRYWLKCSDLEVYITICVIQSRSSETQLKLILLVVTQYISLRDTMEIII